MIVSMLRERSGCSVASAWVIIVIIVGLVDLIMVLAVLVILMLLPVIYRVVGILLVLLVVTLRCQLSREHQLATFDARLCS